MRAAQNKNSIVEIFILVSQLLINFSIILAINYLENVRKI